MGTLIRRGVSTRRALVLVGLSDSSWRYRPRPRQDQELVERLTTLARRHPRYGYRRACALLRRSGERINHTRVLRLWQASTRAVPRRAPLRRQRTGGLPLQATQPNQVWTYDFLEDRTAHGTRLKVLTVVDEATREGLAIATARSMGATDVQRVVAAVMAQRGAPT